MATNNSKTGVKPVDALTGHVTGKRFSVVLDDIHIGDTWNSDILPVLQADGLGKSNLDEGVISFTFKTQNASTIIFEGNAGSIVVHGFTVNDDGKAEA